MLAIQTENLRKQFGDFVAVKGVNLDIPEESSFGLLGPNGAGKSTLIRMLTTLLLPTSGAARVAGHDIVKNADAVRKSIGVIPQALTSDLDLTAAENLTFYAGLYNLPSSRARKLVDELLASADLTQWRNKKVKTFSGGMRRRLEIARSLLHRPRVLFLDEPTTGLDPASRLAMWDTIRGLRAQGGLTVFLTTHYMEEADQLCEQIAIFDHGEIIALDSPANLKARVAATRSMEVRCAETPRQWAEVLSRLPDVQGVEGHDGVWRIQSSNPMATAAALLEAGREHSVAILSLAVNASTLEDVFVHFTGRALREGSDGSTRASTIYSYGSQGGR